MSTFTEPASITSHKKKQTNVKDLILYNDDVNTFDHVIESLVEICDHDSLQAEQCATLVHHKGKCSVKRGEYDKLKPLALALLNRGLSATIE
jgi:ATP-dependent Clp protease adaptor protein ClpS